MEEIPLTEVVRTDFVNYIRNIDAYVTSENTIKSYCGILDRMFKEYDVLSRATAKQMMSRWSKNTKIRAVLVKLNEYFDYNDIDFIIKVPKSKRKERKIPDILSRKELVGAIESMPAEAKLIISCIFNIGAGLRISEVINLKWEDLSWQDWSVENKTLNVKIKNSKRGKDRIVPIPHFTAAELYDYAKTIGKINEDGFPHGGKIFDFGSQTFKKQLRLLEPELWKYEYTRHSYDFIRHNIINRYFKTITNRKITAHSLRHSRASELYHKYKVPLKTIQRWLGHSDIATTMIYIHMANEEDTKIMESVGGI